MSLRSRLLSAILLALLISFSAGAGVAVLQAARGVRAEQASALDNARQGLAAALAAMPAGPVGAASLARIVAAFDGSRHVQATLLSADGQTRMTSRPDSAPPIPAWLRRLIVPSLEPVIVPAGPPGGMVIRLASAPANEAAERWGELGTRLAGFGMFFGLAAVLCSLTVARSLRPLTVLTLGMERVGRGEPAPHLAEAGPRETAALARAFNAMAASLRTAQAQNAALSRQVATIAEEERADIARDLHDEIGPLLFAVTAFAAAIGQQVERGNLSAVPAQLSAIQQAVARLQRAVRDMLARLRDGGLPPADLTQALEDLLAFWRQLRPETRFTLACALPATLGEPVRDCLYRAAQEGISNAIRHGGAGLVAVTAAIEAGAAVLTVRDDGGGGHAADGAANPAASGSGGRAAEGAAAHAPDVRRSHAAENADAHLSGGGHAADGGELGQGRATGGFPNQPGSGLAGMQARVSALGGTMALARGRGWSIRVAVPLAEAQPAPTEAAAPTLAAAAP